MSDGNVYEPMAEWRATFRVEEIRESEPDAPGWMAFDLILRPMDRRGRVNGRTRDLTTLHVGGPPDAIDLTGLEVGRKAEFTYAAGPAPTTRATLRPSPTLPVKTGAT